VSVNRVAAALAYGVKSGRLLLDDRVLKPTSLRCVSPFRTKARLEAEIIILRHQLNVLRRNVPLKPELVPPD
jgi:hypothetical protein